MPLSRMIPGLGRDERGSVLMLMPAAVLVVLVLASIAIDMSLVYLRQRQAVDLAASAANDAVTAGVDQGLLRSGSYRVDPELARQAAVRSIQASELAPHLVGRPALATGSETVAVTISVTVDYLFAGVIPGAPDGTTVTATASATAESADA